MMKNWQFITATVAALCAAGLSGPAAAIDGPVFTGIGDLPGNVFLSSAVAVSGDGNTVAGWGMSDAGGEAIRWSWDAGIQGLGDLPGGTIYSTARDVSEDGTVIVGGSQSAFRSENGYEWAGLEAFRWTEEDGMVGLGDLDGGPFGSHARGVSAGGEVIVGAGDFIFAADPSGGPDEAGASEAFRWTQETGMVGLGDLSGGAVDSVANDVSANGTVVVGYSGFPFGEAFRWTESTGMVGLGSLLDDAQGAGKYSSAYGVSADGDTVVGRSASLDELGAYRFQAFRWTEVTGMVGLGDLPGGILQSRATSVSGDGTVIVGWSVTDIGTEAFVWTESQGMRRLVDVLSDDYGVDVGGWQLIGAMDVSEDGLVIVGVGTNPNGNREGWVVCLRDSCFENGADGDGNGSDGDDDDDDDNEHYHGHGGHGGHGGMMSR